MQSKYHQGPQSLQADDGSVVEFLGHMAGVRYRDGQHTLMFDAEFVAGGAGRNLAVIDRPIANWDPPLQSVRIGPEEASEIRNKVIEALTSMGHVASFVQM